MSPGREAVVVCLCGSTRFKDQFRVAELRESLRGRVVLSLPAFSQADGISFSDDELAVLRALHQRKIELADEILVIDVGGYIGEQTQIRSPSRFLEVSTFDICHRSPTRRARLRMQRHNNRASVSNA